MEKIAEVSRAQLPEPNIGELLVKAGKIRQEDSTRILQMQKEQNLRFGEAAVKLGLVSQDDIMEALASQFNYDYLAPGEENFSPELLTAYHPFTPEVEAFRALRTQLKLRWFSPARKHLAIVGAAEGAGCTYHAANLAVVFSQLGEKTLLIDANLRDPRQHIIFNLGNRQGLSELLSGRVDHAPLVRISKLGSLSVLPSGATPPNPGELLSSGTLKTLLAKLDQYFDVILIDTPPAKIYTDAQTVAVQSGGALLVAKLNCSRLDDIAAIKDSLAVTSTEVAGVAMGRF